MADVNSINAQMLRDRFSYDPETGRMSSVRTGRVYRSQLKDGGKIVVFKKKMLYAYRVAFVLMTGEWPKGVVDHINGDRSDDRWSNLRDVTHQLNSQNLTRAPCHSKSGFLGVTRRNRDNKPFDAAIKVEGKYKFLGSFDTAEEAHQAYLQAKALHHPHAWIVRDLVRDSE